MVTLICLWRVLGMAYTTLPFGVKSVWSEFSSVQPIILIRSHCSFRKCLLTKQKQKQKRPGEKGHGVNTAWQVECIILQNLKSKASNGNKLTTVWGHTI